MSEAFHFDPLRPGQTGKKPGPAEQRLAHDLASALKVARLHSLDNVVCQDALAALHASLNRYLRAVGEVSVIASRGRLRVNGGAFRPARGRSWQVELREALDRLGLAGFRLAGEWSPDAVMELVACTRVEATDPAERAGEVAANLAARLEPPAVAQAFAAGAEGAIAAPSPADQADAVYDRLVRCAADTHAALREGESIDARAPEARQLILQLLESLHSRPFETRLLLRTGGPLHEDALASHALNVAVLSLCMGRLAGFPPARAVELGFAAFYHDVGRGPVGRYPDLGPALVEAAEDHVIEGVRLLLSAPLVGSERLARLVVAQEHHRLSDNFPAASLDAPHPYTRLIATADVFDKLESGSSVTEALSPFDALRRTTSRDRRLDLTTIDLLRSVLGNWPRGTLLELDDRRRAIVLEGGARRGHLPAVRPLLPPDGAPAPADALFVLQHKKQVLRVLPPNTYDTRALLLAR